MSETPWLDLKAYNTLVDELTPFVSEVFAEAKTHIEKREGQPGWIGHAYMTTSEGYDQKEVVVKPTDTSDFSKPWLIDVTWASRDCDGMHDGGYSFLLIYDGMDYNGLPLVRRQKLGAGFLRDHTAEAAGY